MVQLAVCVLIVMVAGCDDGEGIRITNTNPGSSNYVEKVTELLHERDVVRADFDDMLTVWNATHNLEYGRSTATSLLQRGSTIQGKIVALRPTARFEEAHALLVQAGAKLVEAIQHSLRYFESGGTDSDALLQGNIAIVEYNRINAQYNAQDVVRDN